MVSHKGKGRWGSRLEGRRTLTLSILWATTKEKGASVTNQVIDEVARIGASCSKERRMKGQPIEDEATLRDQAELDYGRL